MGSPSQPPKQPQGGGVATAAWALRWRDRMIPLGDTPTVLGRSSQCHVQVEDPLVSRRHACLQVSGDELFLEDLRSANGVFVNGERVRRPKRLQDGDRILLGNEELVVVGRHDEAGLASLDEFPDEPRTLDPEEPSDVHEIVSSHGRPRSSGRGTSSGATTEKAEAFTMLGRLADRLLSQGQPDRAVHVLAELLREVLDAARAGFDLPDEACAQACGFAIKLVHATSDGRWLDYVIELHVALKRPVSAEVLGHVEAALSRGVEVDLALFDRYQAQVRDMRTVAKPAERELCDRVLQLHPSRRG